MPVESEEIPSTRLEKVGRTGALPLSGPVPSSTLPARRQTSLPEERGQPRTRWPSAAEKWLLRLGRGIFGGFFLYNGINHFANGQMLTEYARAKEVPFPNVAVAASGAMLVLGGLSVITGARPKIGASMIAGFLLSVSPQIHNFWRVEDPQHRIQELTQFAKNMALVGGACFAAAIPEPWPLGLKAGEAPVA